ncbi:hypothetical protein ACIQKE_37740 [Streptomyces griseoviridis]|uniref:hypothetical protein n=1 Tax=Streptomyces griseoviridis TaxID=45398 RepID=UPI00340AF6B5
MRERPDTSEESEQGTGRKLDLSLPQVAGSAVAAVIAAKLASSFGVYGTILGAGVVSVIATCGGSVFQHFFRHTGRQIREVGVPARAPHQPSPAPGEFTEGTVYRARVRSWRRPVVAAAVVFGVTMAGITTYELVSGSSFSGRGGTTVSDAVTGRTSSSDPTPEPSDPSSEPGSGDGGAEGAASGSPTPSSDAGQGGSDGSPTPGGDGGTSGSSTPAPTPSASGDGTVPTPAPSASATAPEPSADSRSGTADQGRAGPATP